MQESDIPSNDNNSNNEAPSISDNNQITVADEWSNENPALKSFPFEVNSGMRVNIPDADDPLFFISLLLTDDLIKEVVKCTNAYAERVINSSRPLRKRSVLNEWRDVSEEELKKFLGLVLHMGLVSLPSYREYWSKSRLYHNDLFPSVIPRERFQAIMRFLNFGEKSQHENDRLAKIRLLSNHLNETMKEIYAPP
mgnify:CR=1 FL=1